MKFPLGRIAEFVQGRGVYDPAAVAQGYSIDTRTLRPGELFFAIRGERLDGHDYVEAALKAGAVAAVVEAGHATRWPQSTQLITVQDTTHALQQLGAAARRVWGKKLIAVTGSAGKTTTKDCIAHLLGERYHVLKSLGNLNNHFGLPMQLLRLEPEHDVAVIEMGMSHAGEITNLAQISAPDEGVVTNVGLAHLESFDSQAGIARAKYELIESLPADGHAYLNADDPYVSQFGRDYHGLVTLYGITHPAEWRAEQLVERGMLGSDFVLHGPECKLPARLPLPGRHNVLNALAAVAVAWSHGVTSEECVAALATLTPGDKRGQVIELEGAIVVNDSYNSNPQALESMVSALGKTPATRRVVIAGEMLELGPDAAHLHHQCGFKMAEHGINLVVGVRGNASQIVQGAREAGLTAEFVQTPEEAGRWLAVNLRPGDAVLIKGSRGVGLERALVTFTAERGK